MKFAVIAPVAAGVTADPEWMSAFARHVEACGFESIVAVEHTVLMTEYSSVYPYDASGRVGLTADCVVPIPLTCWCFWPHTERLGLATGVLVLRTTIGGAGQAGGNRRCAIRWQAATVCGDGLAEGGDRACGTDFGSRGRRADEQLEVMRLLWDDHPDGASFHGEFFDFDHAMCYPKPTRRVPIHIGGHSRAGGAAGGRPRLSAAGGAYDLVALMRS